MTHTENKLNQITNVFFSAKIIYIVIILGFKFLFSVEP